MENFIDIGEIVNTHGIRGEIKVNPWTDYPEIYEALNGIYTKDGTYFKITNLKYHKGAVILKLRGVNSVEEAETMRGEIVYTKREYFEDLPRDTYLVADIIGLEVRDNERTYGVITDVTPTGSNDVYTVEMKGRKPLLVPALKSVIKEVNTEEKYMLVELPEGLLDI